MARVDRISVTTPVAVQDGAQQPQAVILPLLLGTEREQQVAEVPEVEPEDLGLLGPVGAARRAERLEPTQVRPLRELLELHAALGAEIGAEQTLGLETHGIALQAPSALDNPKRA
jgi:hypothetical protein